MRTAFFALAVLPLFAIAQDLLDPAIPVPDDALTTTT
jgi:hypothetical protein